MTLANSDLFWWFMLKGQLPDWLNTLMEIGFGISAIVSIILLILFIYMVYLIFKG